MDAITQATKTLSTDNGSDDQQQYLTFMLSGETYAISILSIKEIIQYGQRGITITT